MKSLLQRLFGRPATNTVPLTDLARAKNLIAAIDRGGIPLNPQVVRHVAESFGLEVPRRESTTVTIERIRAALKRSDGA